MDKCIGRFVSKRPAVGQCTVAAAVASGETLHTGVDDLEELVDWGELSD